MPRRDRPPARHLRCGARTRKPGHPPCRRWALQPDRARCRLHGGATPPKRGEDLERARTQRITFGTAMTVESVLRLVEADRPGELAAILKVASAAIAAADRPEASLDEELRLARVLLALTMEAGNRRGLLFVGPFCALLDEVRLLVRAKHLMDPGGHVSGVLEVLFRVVEPEAPTGT